MPDRDDEYIRLPIEPLHGGVNDRHNQKLLAPNQAAVVENVDFNRDSLLSTRGAVKVNNQTAPHCGLRTRVDPALSPLYVKAGVSVPLRGYGYLPFDDRYDIGGGGASFGSGTSSLFHATRGGSFGLSLSFTLPEETKLHGLRNGTDSGPVNSAADADVIAHQLLGGFDVALDEVTILVQKGGDRLSPMSWALGIVNVADKFQLMTGSVFNGASSYVPVFMWLDSPGWGQEPNLNMEYSLSDGQQVGSGEDQFASGALRAFVVTHAILPGTRYHISVDLTVDTGTAGTGQFPTTDWNEDGALRVTIAEDLGAASTYLKASGLHVWKGPTDSIDYLEKYGIRFTGKDAMFLGLGMRQIPYAEHGFIPTGLDGASLEKGGYRMQDLSVAAAPSAHSLTAEHLATGDSFIEVNHQFLHTGNVTQEIGVVGLKVSGAWSALENNIGALRNYWGVLYPSGGGNKHNGLRLKLGDYTEDGASFRLEAGITGRETFGPRDMGIIAFRWHQRDVILEGLRIRDTALNPVADARAEFSLRSHTELDDETEPNRSSLVGYWPLNDGGGAVLNELISGRDGFLMPFGLGVTDSGHRGGKALALSGEGEALVLDFSEHPILKREVAAMLRDGKQGFAVEVTMELPEAYYALDDQITSSPLLVEGEYAPDILTWGVKEQAETGLEHDVRPLLRLTHRARWTHSRVEPSLSPMGFWAEVATASDQEDVDPTEVFEYWNGTTFTWDLDAPWVGKTITLQLGVQSTGTPDTYTIYLAGTPKGDLVPAQGEAPDAELTLFSTSVIIQRKDLERSVVCIGGAWNPGTLGYSELNCRMIIDEVRVFATAAPGAVSSSSGSTVEDGKLTGGRALPPVELQEKDLRHPLGQSLEASDVVDGSATMTAAGNGRFYEDDPWDTLKAVEGTMIRVQGDDVVVRKELTLPDVFEEFYRVDTVVAGGQTLELDSVYEDATREGALTFAFRLIGYTAFGDDIADRQVTLGRGKAFNPGTTTELDAVLTEDLWFNRAPISTNWKLRIFSPLGHAQLRELLPQWVRGVKTPRSNPILGVTSKDGLIVAGVRGALYEVDDRWRDSGPTDDLDTSVAFRARALAGTQVLVGLQSDRIETTESAALDFTGGSNEAQNYDAWVNLDQIQGIQTVLWVGDLATDPSKDAGVHKIQLWLRMDAGRPELVVGSSETFDGTAKPPLGLFVARGNAVIERGTWVHLRWWLRTGASNSILRDPKLLVNGRPVAVSVLTRANGLTTPDWLNVSGIQTSFTTERTVLGVARAVHIQRDVDGTFVEDQEGAPLFVPDTYVGWLHALSGSMADVVVEQNLAVALFDTAASFDPSSLTYTSPAWRAQLQEGIGHLVVVNSAHGTIVSHPFISRLHGFGVSDDPISFASMLNKVYAVNGERPAWVSEQGDSGFAGLQAPTTKPAFEVERIPIWKENVQLANNPENGPVRQGTDGEDPRILHYNSSGNHVLNQAFHQGMTWEKDGTKFDIFGFKCYVRMRSVAGRVPLYSGRSAVDGGGIFLEIRDGVVHAGWYDTLLKKQVWVKTSKPVIKPGFVHYIYLRKRFPQKDGWQGTALGTGDSNWANSIFEFTAAFTYDSLVVRYFPKAAVLDANLDGLEATIGSVSNAISFTTDDVTAPTGTTAQGLVTDPTLTVTATGNTITTAAGTPFQGDMLGMLFQFGSAAANHPAELFRIVAVTGTTLDVKTLDGQTPSLTEAAPVAAGVFAGVSLIKSEDFDESTEPDKESYAIELFGSQLALEETGGITPFDGEAWSWAYVVRQHTGAEGIDVFGVSPSDEIETGTDVFPEDIFNPTLPANDPGPGELRVTGGDVFAEHLCQPYGGSILPVSSQPNEGLEWEQGAQATINAQSWFVRYIDSPIRLEGVTKIQVIFFDPAQNLRSNPGPELEIQPGLGDVSNPSGRVRFLLTQLPASREKGAIERWIFASLLGGDKFLIAKVPDNSSSSASIEVTTEKISQSREVLTYTNAAPPRCSVLGVGLERLWFGALQGQVDAIRWSRSYQPGQVPQGNFMVLLTGGTGPVTGLTELKGRMVVFKRDAIWRIVLTAQGLAVREQVSRSSGCVAHQTLVDLEDRLEFLSDRGPTVYLGQGLPAWVGVNLQGLFTDDVDATKGVLATATLNRRRDQYVATFVEKSRPDVGQRISSEFDSALSGAASGARVPANYRMSRYEDPRVTALGRYQPLGGGIERVLAGTHEGFLVWMDREETLRMLAGDTPVWGDQTITVDGTSLADVIPTDTSSVDLELEGMRGQVARWVAGGVEYALPVLLATPTKVWLDRDASVVAADDATVTLAAQRHVYETGWISFTVPEYRKGGGAWLDIVADSASGSVTVEVYVDEAATPGITEVVNLAGDNPHISLETLSGFHWKFRIRSAEPALPLSFEITALILRVRDVEQR